MKKIIIILFIFIFIVSCTTVKSNVSDLNDELLEAVDHGDL